jgi:hypothetical protein
LVVPEIEQTGRLAVDFTCAFGHAVHRDCHLRLVHSSAVLLPTASQQQQQQQRVSAASSTTARRGNPHTAFQERQPILLAADRQGSVRLVGADRSEAEVRPPMPQCACLSGHAARLTHGGSKPRPLSMASTVCTAKATMKRRWHDATILSCRQWRSSLCAAGQPRRRDLAKRNRVTAHAG